MIGIHPRNMKTEQTWVGVLKLSLNRTTSTQLRIKLAVWEGRYWVKVGITEEQKQTPLQMLGHEESISVLRSRAKFPSTFSKNAKNIALMVIVYPMKTQIERCESLTPNKANIFLFIKLHPSAVTQNHKKLRGRRSLRSHRLTLYLMHKFLI